MLDDGIAFLNDLMVRGGVVMWPIALCSVMSVLITLRKVLQWLRWKVDICLGRKEWQACITCLASGKYPVFHKRLLSPYTAILRDALAAGGDPRVQLEAMAHRRIRQLRRGLSLLDTIVTLAPMLGILGTVTGIITSFDLMGSAGVEDPTGVTAGIAEALITTAAGLVVSIVALLPLNYGKAWCKESTRLLEEALSQAESYFTGTPQV